MIKRKQKTKLIQLTQKDTKIIRKKYWKKQNKKCAILGKKISFGISVLDHKHMTKKEVKNKEYGVDGKGLCRGVLDPRVNSFEGDVLRKYKKRGLSKEIPLPVLLRRLALYLENPTIPQVYIHYKEKQKKEYKNLGKRDYKKICKYYYDAYPRRRGKAIPSFPKKDIKEIKSGKRKGKEIWKTKLTKKWEKILIAVNKIHKNRS